VLSGRRGAAHQPKTEVVETVVRVVPVAESGTQEVWIEAPGPAAQHASLAVTTSSGFPSRSVVLPAVTLIRIVPAVLYPLPDVARHVIRVGVAGQSIHRRQRAINVVQSAWRVSEISWVRLSQTLPSNSNPLTRDQQQQ